MTQTAGDARATGAETPGNEAEAEAETETETAQVPAKLPAQVPAQAERAAGEAVPEATPAPRTAAPRPATPRTASANPLARLLTLRTTPQVLRWTTFAALVVNVAIIVTGGAVRLTDSGLGCPTWPTCTDGNLVPTSRLGVWGIIEFTNRQLTFVVSAVVGLAVVACMRYQPHRAVLSKLAWWLFGGVVAQAVIGGISVRTHLAPTWVSLHMVVSLAMVSLSYVLWVRSREPGDDKPAPTVQPILRQLGYVLTAGVGALLIAGTIVTGSGPHSGAKAGDPGNKRLPLSPANATQLHADLVFLVVGLTVALWFALKATGAPARVLTMVRDLFLLLMAQGVIGYVQYFTHLPVLLVGLHMFGAAIVWVGTWRVLLAMRERESVPAAAATA